MASPALDSCQMPSQQGSTLDRMAAHEEMPGAGHNFSVNARQSGAEDIRQGDHCRIGTFAPNQEYGHVHAGQINVIDVECEISAPVKHVCWNGQAAVIPYRLRHGRKTSGPTPEVDDACGGIPLVHLDSLLEFLTHPQCRVVQIGVTIVLQQSQRIGLEQREAAYLQPTRQNSGQRDGSAIGVAHQVNRTATGGACSCLDDAYFVRDIAIMGTAGLERFAVAAQAGGNETPPGRQSPLDLAPRCRRAVGTRDEQYDRALA